MAVSEESVSLEELEEERDFLLASLADLERERAAGDIDPVDYETLSDGYTARAAAVIRAIDARSGRAASAARPAISRAAPPSAREVRRGRPGRAGVRTLAVVALVAMFAVGAGVLVAATSGDRLPGQPTTGAIPASEADNLAKAQQLISENKLLQAVQAYDAVLAADPKNVEALAYKGWLLRLAGKAGGAGGQTGSGDLINRAQQSIEAAVATDPSYPDAHFFLGMILYEDRDDPVNAITQFRLFMANQPPQQMVPVVEAELQKAMQTAKDRGLPDPGPAPGVGVVTGPQPGATSGAPGEPTTSVAPATSVAPGEPTTSVAANG